MLLVSIVLATLAGGILSVVAAAILSHALLASWVPRMVSFAVGALLSAAFLDLLPEAMDSGIGAQRLFGTVLIGLLGFFLLEKFALWRHSHGEGSKAQAGADSDSAGAHAHHAHGHGHHGSRIKPSGMMIVVGDSLHNLVDGVVIAAAFLSDVTVGWAVAIAVIAHEIPQEVGDFMVLLDAGYTKARALAMNILSSLASVAGGVIGYFALGHLGDVIPYVQALAAASLIYIAVADLVPELHRRYSARDALSQIVLIGLGIGIVWFAGTGR